MIPDIQKSLIYLIVNQINVLLRQTLRFSESYSDPEETSSRFFHDKNGA